MSNPLLQNNVLIILSGVSGSGKSTFADFINFYFNWNHHCTICTADDYHYDDEGNYKFDISNLSKAHAWCQEKAFKAMDDEHKCVVIANTSTSPKEYNPYKNYAEKRGYKVVAIVMQNLDGNKNIHNVPNEVLNRQEMKLYSNLKLK